METFGQRLSRLRLERKMSQRELAEASGGKGVTYAYISRLEAGKRQPSIGAIRKLATGLGVNPVYLETGKMLICPHCGRSM